MIASAVSLLADSFARCSRSHRPSASTSGFERACRTALRPSGGLPAMSRSMAKSSSMRRTASMATGALASLASSMNLRLECARHAPEPVEGLDDRAGLPAAFAKPVEPGEGVGLHHAGPSRQMRARMPAMAGGRIFEEGGGRHGAAEGPVVPEVDPDAPRAHDMRPCHLRQDSSNATPTSTQTARVDVSISTPSRGGGALAYRFQSPEEAGAVCKRPFLK